MSFNHAQRFQRLTRLLAEWQSVWRPLPFQHPIAPWSACFPGRVEQLKALSDADVDRLQEDPLGDSVLAGWLPVAALRSMVELPALPGADIRLPKAWSTHVPGRKWHQIDAFVSRVAAVPQKPLVEWCAGKGHLSRALSRLHHVPVTGLEWQGSLCRSGQTLADSQGAEVRFELRDVMRADATRGLVCPSHLVALHACGDLHARLLAVVAAQGHDLTLAPCCYHLTADDSYRPLSCLGRDEADEHDLWLSRQDLQLAVQETVTAPLGVQRARQRANAWRLGFDALQRDLRGRDEYLPVPSLAYGRLPGSFEGFCRWAAEQKGLDLPEDVDWQSWEQSGWHRQAQVSRLELVRQCFRRALEVWLVLDRVLYLEEAGFAVELGTFCERELTPRNLLLRAQR
jgi:hypothetical protein